MQAKNTVIAAVAAAAAAGVLYASPYVTLYRIAQAVERKDAVAVSSHVDFPALRESVKAQALARLQPHDPAPQDDNPLAGFGRRLASGLVEQMVQALVSPNGVMLMLEKGKPGKPADVAAAGVGIDPGNARPHRDYALDYQDWSHVFVHPKEEQGGFVFERRNLISWKLVGVRMD